MYYVMSVIGYECYVPVWFRSDRSAEEFKSAVREVTEKIVTKLLLEPDLGFMDGHKIIGEYCPELSKNILKDEMAKLGFEMIKADLEISFTGECLYGEDDRRERPDQFSNDTWDKILAHNQKIHDSLDWDSKDNERSKEE